MLSDDYARVPCSAIVIDRDTRQRTAIDIDVDGFKESIRDRGVIQPIIITRDMVLVAGERRLTASIAVGHPDIPVRFSDTLSLVEHQIIELEENYKRQELPWRDQVRAIEKLHNLYLAGDPEWSQVKTADSIGVKQHWVSKHLRVARDLDSPKLASATGIENAYNILSKIDERVAGDAVSALLNVGGALATPPVQAAQPALVELPGTTLPVVPAPATPPAILPASESILQASFLEWAPQYSGLPFNFIHCDFPYGIGVFDGEWGNTGQSAAYDDSESTYWALVECLCLNIDRLLGASGHIMFWYSMEYHTRTIEAFRRLAPSLAVQSFPLVWHKTDNVGIAPDAKRQPRRVYETALIASKGDRPIVKVVGNAYGAPTNRALHPSTKPEAVLRHFMQLFVDEQTRMLDPTCGSGSALRAAESMNAKYVLGLEIDPEHHRTACDALTKFRNLRSLSK